MSRSAWNGVHARVSMIEFMPLLVLNLYRNNQSTSVTSVSPEIWKRHCENYIIDSRIPC